MVCVSTLLLSCMGFHRLCAGGVTSQGRPAGGGSADVSGLTPRGGRKHAPVGRWRKGRSPAAADRRRATQHLGHIHCLRKCGLSDLGLRSSSPISQRFSGSRSSSHVKHLRKYEKIEANSILRNTGVKELS